ncbi:MAG: HD domain-containing protein [Butyricicoccus sp.]
MLHCKAWRGDTNGGRIYANETGFFDRTRTKTNPQANIKKIRAAYECAAKAHEGQKRRNGEPYIIHPVAVAEIVVEMGLDTDSICAALLHDCIEDTEFGYKEIENNSARRSRSWWTA